MADTDAVIGREAILDAIGRLLERVRARPAALFLEGEAGIGKTTLWRRGVEAAAGCSFAVLAARPAEAEASLAYSALGDLLRPFGVSLLRSLPEPQRVALEAALLEAPQRQRAPDRRTVSVGFLNALRELAAVRPVLVAVDDLQWLDAPSRRLLAYALRRLRGEQVGLLATLRSEADAPLAELEAFPEETRERVQVGPLGIRALHELVRARSPFVPPRPVMVRVHRVVNGNPLYALEVVRLLGEGAPAKAGRLPVPEQVRTLIASRVRGLPTATREALLQVAASSRPTVALVDPELLTPAEEAGMVVIQADGRIAFSHPLYASAVYERASETHRRRVHGRLAGITDDVEERARHRALAAGRRDADAAADLCAAAERALSRGAPDAAALLLEQACELSVAADFERSCTVAAASCHVQAGDLDRAKDLLRDAVASLGPGAERARALWRLAEVHLYQDDFAEAVRLLQRALGENSNHELAAEIELDLAYAHNAIGDMPAADRHGAEATRLAAGLDNPGLLAEALAVSSIAAFLLGRGVDWEVVDRAVALEDWSRPSIVLVRPTLIAALLRSWTGDLAGSRAHFDRLRRQLSERGDEAGLVMGSFFQVLPLCWGGDVVGACRLAEEMLEQAALVGGDAMRAAALAAATFAHAYAGWPQRVTAESDEALELFSRIGWVVGAAWPSNARGFLELSRGDPDAAERALSPLVALMADVGLAEPWAAAPFLPDAIEALLRIGRQQEAEHLLNRLETDARRLDRAAALAAAARCRALLLADAGRVRDALQQVEVALGQHTRVAMPIERARTLLVKGQLERRARQRWAAADSFREALTIFEETGATLWAQQAAAELARAQVRRVASGDLTETERCVAELAGAGRTNREVAAQLFMSPKTVETNLARAYRKLGVHSRAELGARLAGRGNGEPKS